MAVTLAWTTCSAVAHEYISARDPMGAESARCMRAKEHLRAGSTYESTSGLAGLTCSVVGNGKLEEARDHKRVAATLSTMQPLLIPATKACVCGSARFRSTYNMVFWALKVETIQTHSSQLQPTVMERLESVL